MRLYRKKDKANEAVKQPMTHPDLSPLFVDDRGLQWYRFHSLGDMALDRLERIEYWQMLIQARLDAEEFKAIFKRIKELSIETMAAEGRSPRIEAGSKIVALCEEASKRESEGIIPANLLYRLMADYYVRIDEVGQPFNSTTSDDKFSWIFDNRQKLGSFFCKANIVNYVPILDIGATECKAIEIRWELEKMRMEELMKLTTLPIS